MTTKQWMVGLAIPEERLGDFYRFLHDVGGQQVGTPCPVSLPRLIADKVIEHQKPAEVARTVAAETARAALVKSDGHITVRVTPGVEQTVKILQQAGNPLHVKALKARIRKAGYKAPDALISAARKAGMIATDGAGVWRFIGGNAHDSN